MTPIGGVISPYLGPGFLAHLVGITNQGEGSPLVRFNRFIRSVRFWWEKSIQHFAKLQLGNRLFVMIWWEERCFLFDCFLFEVSNTNFTLRWTNIALGTWTIWRCTSYKKIGGFSSSDPSPCWDLQAVLGATDSGQVIVLCPTLEDELRPASRQSCERRHSIFGKTGKPKWWKDHRNRVDEIIYVYALYVHLNVCI